MSKVGGIKGAGLVKREDKKRRHKIDERPKQDGFVFEKQFKRIEDAPEFFFKTVDAVIETLREQNLKTGDVVMDYIGAKISARIDLVEKN